MQQAHKMLLVGLGRVEEIIKGAFGIAQLETLIQLGRGLGEVVINRAFFNGSDAAQRAPHLLQGRNHSIGRHVGLFTTNMPRDCCGTDCRPVKQDGRAVCPVSGRVVGALICTAIYAVDEEEEDETAPVAIRRRVSHDDPERNNEKLAQANEIYKKLFADRVFADYREPLRGALAQAKQEKKDLRAIAQTLREQVERQVFLESELAAITEQAIHLSQFAQCDFPAVLCALLSCQAQAGLKYMGRVIIAPHPKVALLLPAVRKFESCGVSQTLCTTGMNAIVRVLHEIPDQGLPQQTMGPPITFSRKKRRL